MNFVTIKSFEYIEECSQFLERGNVKYIDLFSEDNRFYLIYEAIEEDENLVRLNKNVQLFNSLLEAHKNMGHYIKSRGKFGYDPETQLAQESICNGIQDVIADMASDYETSLMESKIPSPRKEYERLFSKKLDEANKLPEGMIDCCFEHQHFLAEGKLACENKPLMEQLANKTPLFELVKKMFPSHIFECVEDSTLYQGECPLCQKKKCKLMIQTNKNIFLSTMCNETGDALSFYAQVNKISPAEAALCLIKDSKLNERRNQNTTE